MELFVWTTVLALAAGLMGSLTLLGFILIERRSTRAERDAEPEEHHDDELPPPGDEDEPR